MQRIVMTALFQGEAAAPSGDPPHTDPRASSISIEAVVADGSDAGIERASYENHAVYTSESTFAETGTIRFEDGAGTTNFLLWPATGQFEERQVAVVFVP
jgi:hypothetical protein